MDKKQYILTLLKALQKTRPMAEWLYKLVEDNALDDQTLESLLQTFKRAVSSVTDKVEQNKLKKSIDVVEKIQSLEQISQAEDKEELKDLDQILQNF